MSPNRYTLYFLFAYARRLLTNLLVDLLGNRHYHCTVPLWFLNAMFVASTNHTSLCSCVAAARRFIGTFPLTFLHVRVVPRKKVENQDSESSSQERDEWVTVTAWTRGQAAATEELAAHPR